MNGSIINKNNVGDIVMPTGVNDISEAANGGYSAPAGTPTTLWLDRKTSQDAPELSPLQETAGSINTQDSIALVCEDKFKDQYIFMHGEGKWYQWAGTHWRCDILNNVMENIRSVTRACAGPTSKSENKQNFYSGVETIMQNSPVFAREIKDFDTNNYLFNCPDGTLNLLTGTMQPHDPKDCITLISAVSPQDGTPTAFLKFLAEVTDGDQELVDFLQLSLGGCLSGAIEDHWLLFLIGSSARNGKSTLGELIMDIFGDYGGNIPSSTLMSTQHEGHATEMMAFKGKRLVIASEVEEGGYFAENRIKELTGEKYITARHMRQDHVTYTRTAKILVYGNYRPQLRGADRAIEARMKIIPFNVSFLGREDVELPTKLRREMPLILQWLREGHQRWLDQGKKVGTCAAVTAELTDYLESQSTIDMWISERCVLVDNLEATPREWAKSGELYSDYSTWKKDRGESPLATTRWSDKMRNQGFQKKKSNGVRYSGINLLEPDTGNYGDHKW